MLDEPDLRFGQAGARRKNRVRRLYLEHLNFSTELQLVVGDVGGEQRTPQLPAADFSEAKELSDDDILPELDSARLPFVSDIVVVGRNRDRDGSSHGARGEGQSQPGLRDDDYASGRIDRLGDLRHILAFPVPVPPQRLELD